MTCQEMLHVPVAGVIYEHSLEQSLILNFFLGTAVKALKKNLWAWIISASVVRTELSLVSALSQFPKSWCHQLSKSVPREWFWHTSGTQIFSMCAELLHSSAKPFTSGTGEHSGNYRRLHKSVPFCVKIQVQDRGKRPPFVLTDNVTLIDPPEIESEV